MTDLWSYFPTFLSYSIVWSIQNKKQTGKSDWIPIPWLEPQATELEKINDHSSPRILSCLWRERGAEPSRQPRQAHVVKTLWHKCGHTASLRSGASAAWETPRNVQDKGCQNLTFEAVPGCALGRETGESSGERSELRWCRHYEQVGGGVERGAGMQWRCSPCPVGRGASKGLWTGHQSRVACQIACSRGSTQDEFYGNQTGTLDQKWWALEVEMKRRG